MCKKSSHERARSESNVEAEKNISYTRRKYWHIDILIPALFYCHQTILYCYRKWDKIKVWWQFLTTLNYLFWIVSFFGFQACFLFNCTLKVNLKTDEFQLRLKSWFVGQNCITGSCIRLRLYRKSFAEVKIPTWGLNLVILGFLVN